MVIKEAIVNDFLVCKFILIKSLSNLILELEKKLIQLELIKMYSNNDSPEQKLFFTVMFVKL